MASVSLNDKLVAVTTKLNCVFLRLSDFLVNEIEIEPPRPHRFLPPKEFSLNVVSSAISPCGKWLAYCLSNKTVSLWDNEKWAFVSTRILARGASKAVFTPDSQNVIVSDKAGEVYSFSVNEPNERGRFLLGHISVITDMILTPDNFIITCDRDEKIHVAHYPHTYNIQSFCLGHEEFVTSVNVFSPNQKTIVSSSGDGTLRFWNYLTGNQLSMYNCSQDVEKDTSKPPVPITCVKVSKLSGNVQILCVSLHKHKNIFIYHVNNTFNVSLKQRITLPNTVLTMFFCENHDLWALSSSGLQAFSLDNKTEQFIAKVDDRTQSILSILNGKLAELAHDLDESSDSISVLYKRKVDEVQDYQQKKKARLEKEIDDYDESADFIEEDAPDMLTAL